MRITGSQFMAFLDEMGRSILPLDDRWDDAEAKARGLVDADGNWRLDPEASYQLSDLGRIAAGHKFLVVDTERSVRTTLAWLGLLDARPSSEPEAAADASGVTATVTVLIPRPKHAMAAAAARREGAKVVAARSNGSRVSGADVADFVARGIPSGHAWVPEGEPASDPRSTYDLRSLGRLEPTDPASGATTASAAMRAFLKERELVPLVLEGEEGAVHAAERAARMFEHAPPKR